MLMATELKNSGVWKALLLTSSSSSKWRLL